MAAREYDCTLTSKTWLTPSVLALKFEPKKKFSYLPGQFLSIMIPPGSRFNPRSKRLRRIYSFASTRERGYELCIKITGGPGPAYMASLEVGDTFRISAAYGDFLFQPSPGRNAMFISTGTGIAPFRAMVQSKEFQENPPEHAINLYGCRSEQEILYTGEFEELGVRTVCALSKPANGYPGFRGRVTDYLMQLPADFDWLKTDFYLCGNGEMVAEARRILRSKGVEAKAIFQEVYFSNAQTGAGTSPSVEKEAA